MDKEYENIPDDVREVINPHIKQIFGLADTIEKLSICLENSRLRMALCHTDIHHWNLMQSENQLILIDWEGLRLAPIEADLMFLVDEPYYDEFLNTYQKTYKNFAINPDALQFYQVRRKLEDIWGFIEQLLFDKQNAQERASTINRLTKELKDISE